MKIRDSHAILNGIKDVFVPDSGAIEIIADDGRALFGISQDKDGELRVWASGTCKQAKILLDDKLILHPVAANSVDIMRLKYEK